MLKKIFMGVCCIIVAFTFSGCNKIPAIEQTTGDYILNISVSATTFNEGEEIEVAMTFENNSGEEQQIIHPFPMITAFVIEEGSYGFGDSASYITLAQGTTIKESFFGGHLKNGEIEYNWGCFFFIRLGVRWRRNHSLFKYNYYNS